MTSPSLDEKIEFIADVLFKNLTGLTRSEDTSLNFYGMALEKQNATENDFKQFAFICAKIFITGWKKSKAKGKVLTDEESEVLMQKSLESGWKEFNGQ